MKQFCALARFKPHVAIFRMPCGEVMWEAHQKRPKDVQRAYSRSETPVMAVRNLIDFLANHDRQADAIEGYRQVGPC